MNHAILDKSVRLKSFLRCLKRLKNPSTLEIILATGYPAVSTMASELRAQGYGVKCQRIGKIWRYRLV